jgi:hypothetical protein
MGEYFLIPNGHRAFVEFSLEMLAIAVGVNFVVVLRVMSFRLKFKRVSKKSLRNKVNTNVNLKKLWNCMRLKKAKH